jgi:hypothetical protein
MEPLVLAQVELAESVEPEGQELTVELEEPEGQARLVVEPAVVWALLLAAALAVKAALVEMDLMQAL